MRFQNVFKFNTNVKLFKKFFFKGQNTFTNLSHKVRNTALDTFRDLCRRRKFASRCCRSTVTLWRRWRRSFQKRSWVRPGSNPQPSFGWWTRRKTSIVGRFCCSWCRPKGACRCALRRPSWFHWKLFLVFGCWKELVIDLELELFLIQLEL